ncbi:unnamed protein product [Caenorhabditis angaria]|uniref:Uncharacterized protein n=1 Tax=Caenorhabditis angaria TaxID=860376 RepID=A0A9P1IV87_9PELO|nr:unnamed protein product [Caenorhabditis angaria]
MSSEAEKRKKRAALERARLRRKDDTIQKALEMLKPRKGKHPEPTYLSREEIIQRFCKQYIKDFPAVLENTKKDNNLRMRRSIKLDGLVFSRFVAGRFKNDSEIEEVKDIYNTGSDKSESDGETIDIDSKEEAVCSTHVAEPIHRKNRKIAPSKILNGESSSSSSSSGVELPSVDTFSSGMWWTPSSKTWTIEQITERDRVNRLDDEFQHSLALLKPVKRSQNVSRAEILEKLIDQYVEDFPDVKKNTEVDNGFRMRRTLPTDEKLVVVKGRVGDYGRRETVYQRTF